MNPLSALRDLGAMYLEGRRVELLGPDYRTRQQKQALEIQKLLADLANDKEDRTIAGRIRSNEHVKQLMEMVKTQDRPMQPVEADEVIPGPNPPIPAEDPSFTLQDPNTGAASVVRGSYYDTGRDRELDELRAEGGVKTDLAIQAANTVPLSAAKREEMKLENTAADRRQAASDSRSAAREEARDRRFSEHQTNIDRRAERRYLMAELPGHISTPINAGVVALENLGDVEKQLGTLDKLIGPVRGRVTSLEQAFGATNTTEETALSSLQQYFNTLGELRSGKVITANEYERLIAELQTKNNSPEQFRGRLTTQRRYLTTKIRAFRDTLNPYHQAAVDRALRGAGVTVGDGAGGGGGEDDADFDFVNGKLVPVKR